jgi:hypothetical protein
MCNGDTKTNLQQSVDFKWWQYPFAKNLILANCFWWDVLFELIFIHSNVHNPSQMQGMDRKYNGHVLV